VSSDTLHGVARTVPATYGRQPVSPDDADEVALSAAWRTERRREDLLALLAAHAGGESPLDARMRRVIWRAIARRFGHGIRIGRHVLTSHLDTFEIEDGAFIGDQAIVQGRYDGRCVIGRHAWIGPQAFLDARDLEIGEYVGWGPGARVLGSQHTGQPADVPIIQTDLHIRPVRVGAWADIGVNAVIMPGVAIGKGAIVGAGAVVTADVAPFAIVAGVPAKFLRWREGSEGTRDGDV
jgi:acetyltransferase-like isoleucine patch superfamily enzyme